MGPVPPVAGVVQLQFVPVEDSKTVFGGVCMYTVMVPEVTVALEELFVTTSE